MTAERITTNGRAWHDPQGGTTAWQREQERGELQPMEQTNGDRWLSVVIAAQKSRNDGISVRTLLLACLMGVLFGFAIGGWVLS